MGDVFDIAKQKTGDTRRFAAFISYSHADAAAAAKLQRKLERYRLPKHIAQARSGDELQIGPIFRDREDFAAAASLSAAIRDALKRAEALIVMCSRDAASSPWVAAEIEMFRELHPDRPILAVLLSNEPAVSFPASLTAGGNEPLAADLRPEGDGEQLAFLKIVAGIAGVPLDELIQRDAQRRIRRVTAITGGALAAMLIMGIMTTLALQARNEATRQRASAEGLVEYMLTDLREKLRGVGRQDVMDTVNSRAMEHYRQQGNLASLPADSLERRARLLHAMGEDDGKAGNLDAALANFREAHRTTAALLQQDPGNADRIFAHAQSEYWVGQAAWNKRDRPTTQRHWQGYVEQAAKLIKVDRNKARAHLEMGYALGNMCDLYLYENHDVKKAISYCRQSIIQEEFALKHAPDDSEILTALANRHGWLADSLLADGNFAGARSARFAEREIITRLLAKDPKNVELRFRRLWPEIGLATIDAASGQRSDVSGRVMSMNTELEALIALSPGNIQLNRAQARIWMLQAESLAKTDRSGAHRSLEKSRRIIDDYQHRFGKQEELKVFYPRFRQIEEEIES